MKEKKRKLLKIFLGSEIAVIALYYIFSSAGLQALREQIITIINFYMI